MIELENLMERSLVELALTKKEGNITPLILDKALTGGLGLCNPSILSTDKRGNFLINVRNVSFS